LAAIQTAFRRQNLALCAAQPDFYFLEALLAVIGLQPSPPAPSLCKISKNKRVSAAKYS
jgi:hypothetical protein